MWTASSVSIARGRHADGLERFYTARGLLGFRCCISHTRTAWPRSVTCNPWMQMCVLWCNVAICMYCGLASADGLTCAARRRARPDGRADGKEHYCMEAQIDAGRCRATRGDAGRGGEMRDAEAGHRETSGKKLPPPAGGFHCLSLIVRAHRRRCHGLCIKRPANSEP
jgi:hypothetical protein